MTPREELEALRRLNELEAKAAGGSPDFSNVQSGSSTVAAKRGPSTYGPGKMPGVATEIGGMLDGLQHHVLNIPVGLGQLTQHGINAAANAVLPQPRQTMSGLVSGRPAKAEGIPQRLRQYINVETVKGDAQVRQREADYQQRTDGNMGSYVGAAAGEVLPWMTGVAALNTAGKLPQITATGTRGLLQKGGLLAGEGALFGLSQPVLNEGSYGAEKAKQVALNAAVAPGAALALKGVGAGLGAARQGARYLTPGGRERIANQRVAGLLGDDPATLEALRGAPSVPGYTLTPAQAIGTPEAVQAERVLRNNGLTAPAFAATESANNAAMRAEVAKLAGDDAARTAATRARTDATAPYYAKLPGQSADAAPILAALDNLHNSSFGVNKNIKAAIASIRGEIESRAGSDGKIGADILSGLHEQAGSHLGPMASRQEKKALGPLRDTIAETIDAAVPGYRDNLAAYARTSQPLTDMASGRALLDAIDSGGRDGGGNQAVTLTQLKSLLAKDDKAKYKLSPQARQQLEAIRDALQRRSITNNTIAATGPGTAADTLRGGLQSPLAQRGITGAAATIGGLLGNVPGTIAAILASEGALAASNAVTRKVGQKASSAPLAAEAIEAHNRQLLQQQQGLLGQSGMPSYLLPYRE